jgi:hypothetical protein
MTNPTHKCATCGWPIRITRRNPNKRYCSPRCRVADWHRRHDRPPHPTNAVPNHVPNAVPNHVPQPATTFTPPANIAPGSSTTANGDQHCPHCREPIAVIAVLVPPTAAHVRTPEVTIPLNNR